MTGKQVKCPRCGSATPLPNARLEPMSLRAASSPPPAPSPLKPIPDDGVPLLPEEPKAKSTVETYFSEEPLPDTQGDDPPRAVELAGLGARLSGRLPAREAAALVESLARAVDAANRQANLRRQNRSDGAAPESDGLAREAVLRDVRALGAILYECILGRPPAAEPSKETEAHPQLSLRAKAPRPLEVICLKSLEKNPSASYMSVQELADDLGRFLGSEAVRVRSSRRQRGSGFLGLLVAALLSAGAVGAVGWFSNAKLLDEVEAKTKEAKDAQEQEKEAAKRAEQELVRATAEARTASEAARTLVDEAKGERDRAVQAEQAARDGREAAEKQRAQAQKLCLERTKDLLVGKWKTTFPEKEKAKILEFTPGGSILTMPGAGNGTYRLLGADTLEIQMSNTGAVKEQFRILKFTWNELILKGPDGKERKAERK
jgi:hypothetical protein